MRAFAGIAVLGLAACGHAARGPVDPPPDPADPPAATLTAFPPRPPFVAPGEQMAYRLSMHGLDVASYAIAVGEVTRLDGVDVVVVQAGVQSSRLVSMVKKVEDNFTSWIDVATSRPVLFRAAELASPDADATDVESTDAEAGRLVDGAFPVRVKRVGQPEVVEIQRVGEPPLFDFNGFLLELRGWSPPVGTVGTADVIRSRYLWRTTVTFVGYEQVVTALGELPALRFDGVSRRVGRDGAIDPKSDERHYSLWVSDDADRVPVQLVARTDYGDLRMDIVDYRPGGTRIGE